MPVSIRLRREGAKNRPYYKVVVADSCSPRDGKFIEIIGTYDPKISGHNSSLNVERAEYWIGKGAQPSDTVPAGIVISTSPAAGARAQKGSTVTMLVSSGASTTTSESPTTSTTATSTVSVPNVIAIGARAHEIDPGRSYTSVVSG